MVKKILILILSVIIFFFTFNLFLALLPLTYVLLKNWNDKLRINRALKNNSSLKRLEFYSYVKEIILLSYSNPLKNCFEKVNVENYTLLSKQIVKFTDQLKIDFTITPYNNFIKGINGSYYEKNVVKMLYLIEKKGLGKDYISDLLQEVDDLQKNEIDQQLQNFKERSYVYNLLPTITLFIYITFVLFQVINSMIMEVL